MKPEILFRRRLLWPLWITLSVIGMASLGAVDVIDTQAFTTDALTVTGNATVGGTFQAITGDVTIGGTGQVRVTGGGGVQVNTVSGTLTLPRLLSFNGNPNTVVTAVEGSLLMDTSTPGVWINTTGAAVWTQLATSGGATPFYDTVLGTHTFNTGNGTIYNNVNLGLLGQNTLIPYTMSDSTASSVITGFTNNGVNMQASDNGRIITLQPVGVSNGTRIGNNELSVAANRIRTPNAADDTGFAFSFRYSSTDSLWHAYIVSN
jgi:hypothetical protein